jgi:hypothetical protein
MDDKFNELLDYLIEAECPTDVECLRARSPERDMHDCCLECWLVAAGMWEFISEGKD